MNIGLILTQSLVFLTSFTGSLAAAVVLFTIIARVVLLPLTIPSIKATKKMRDVQPELKKLKEKHGKDKKAMQQAQLDLYKKYNINPLSGCLPQIIQIGLFIAIYHALIEFLKLPDVTNGVVNVMLLWIDMRNPDPYYVVPLLAGVSQLFFSLMIAPGAEHKDIVPNTSSKKLVKEENKKEEDMAEMAASMQQQMLFIMPVMTTVLAVSFPAGLGLYWIASTLFSIVQQYYISGWGGLVVYTTRATSWVKQRIATK